MGLDLIDRRGIRDSAVDVIYRRPQIGVIKSFPQIFVPAPKKARQKSPLDSPRFPLWANKPAFLFFGLQMGVPKGSERGFGAVKRFLSGVFRSGRVYV